MYPYCLRLDVSPAVPLLNLTFGPWQAGTFGLLFCGWRRGGDIGCTRTSARNGVDADAINVAALVVVAMA